MYRSVAFSICPRGYTCLMECMSSMVSKVSKEKGDELWSVVQHALLSCSLWAAVENRQCARVVLTRVRSLLQVVLWGAKSDMLPPHPFLRGKKIIYARFHVGTHAWAAIHPYGSFGVQLVNGLARARRVLSELAWHLHLRGQLREFLWRRSCSRIVSECLRVLTNELRARGQI